MSTTRAQLEVRRPGRDDLPPIVMVGWPDMENALVAQLPRAVPIWWLKLDGFFAPPFEIRPLAAIAAASAEEISNLRPQGPIHLVGFSVGGLIAAELSERLHCAGRKAQALLLEPPLPGGLPARAKLRRRAKALHKTELEQHRAARANAAESLRERFCRHLSALCRRRPLGWIEYIEPRLIGLSGRLRELVDERVLRSYRERRIRPWLNEIVRQGLSVPVRHRAWWYYGPQVHNRVVAYSPPLYTGPIYLAGSRRWLETYGPTWDVLVPSGKLFYCEIPNSRNHIAITSRRESRVWMKVIRNWYVV